MRLFIHAIALSSALVACGSSAIPSIDPPAAADADAGASAAPVSPEGPGSSAAPSESGTPASDAGSATPSVDAAPAPPESRFDVSVDGSPQKITQTRAVYMPAEHWLAVRAHVVASSAVPEGDLIVFFTNMTASGNVSCAQARIVFQTATGKQYDATGDASCQLTGVSIGPVGGTVDGSFDGTLRAHPQSSAMDVTFSFSVVRAPDSELL